MKLKTNQVIKDNIENLLYDVRNGLYHSSSLIEKIGLDGSLQDSLFFDSKKSSLTINPHKLIPRLIIDLEEYKTQLSDNANKSLRQNFEKRFDIDNQALVI